MSSCPFFHFSSSSSSSPATTTLPFPKTLITPFFVLSLLRVTSAVVHLRGDTFSYTFLDVPAHFAVPIDGSGICGSLHVADPMDACSPLRNVKSNFTSPVRVLLAERGSCSFQKKVHIAQDAGFRAVVVYNDREKGHLISMIGESEGIWIHAVFVSKMAGETLKKYARGKDGECCLAPSVDVAVGAALIISLISLVIVVSVLATFFFARNFRRLRHSSHGCPQHISRQELKDLPCIKFETFSDDHKPMSDACAICLEDYKDGETLRVLPCQHEFHSHCVDSWLTKWGTSCPVCKHDLSSKR